MHTIHRDQKNHSHLSEALALAALGAGMLAGRWIRKRQIAARQKRAATPNPIVPVAHAAGAVAPGAAEPSPALIEALARASAQLEIDRNESAAPSLLAADVAPSVDPSDAPAGPETFAVDVRGGQITTRGDANGDAMLRWRTFRDALIDARGHSADANGTLYPNTTIDDVQQVAVLWTEWLTTHSYALLDSVSVRVRWMLACARIDQALGHDDLGALYSRNKEFWLDELHGFAHAIAKHGEDFHLADFAGLIKKLGAQRHADLHGHSAAAFAVAETALADTTGPTSAPTETEPCATHDHRSGNTSGSTAESDPPEPCNTHDHRSGEDVTETGTACDEPSDGHDHRSAAADVSAVLTQQAALIGMRALDRAARALRSPTVLGALLAFGGAALITAKR